MFSKLKQLVYKKSFHVLLQAIITNEVPVTILQAYISLPRHIRKGALIRRFLASHICTAVDCQEFRKASRNGQTRLLRLNVVIPFSIFVFFLVVTVRNLPKTIFWVTRNEGHNWPLGSRAPCSNGTEIHPSRLHLQFAVGSWYTMLFHFFRFIAAIIIFFSTVSCPSDFWCFVNTEVTNSRCLLTYLVLDCLRKYWTFQKNRLGHKYRYRRLFPKPAIQTSRPRDLFFIMFSIQNFRR